MNQIHSSFVPCLIKEVCLSISIKDWNPTDFFQSVIRYLQVSAY